MQKEKTTMIIQKTADPELEREINDIINSIIQQGRICAPDIELLRQHCRKNNSLMTNKESEFLINNARNWAHFVIKSKKKRMVLLQLVKNGSMNPKTIQHNLKKHNASYKLVTRTLKELKDWEWVIIDQEKGYRNETFYSLNDDFNTIIRISVNYILKDTVS